MNKKIFLVLFVALLGFLSGCVKDEVFQGPPTISDVAFAPQSPAGGQTITVSAKVTDNVGIQEVRLFYKVEDGNFQKVIMQKQGENLYTGEIPGQDENKTIFYYIEAENTGKLITRYPSGAPAQPASLTIGAPVILINEIYSRGTASDPDWVELYNASDVEANISGYKIYDAGGQSGTKPKKVITDGTIIPAKGFFVIVVDDGTESGFGLSSGGEKIWLENAKGNVIDEVEFPAMETTQSYGRYPDGAPTLQLLNTITRGSANAPGGTTTAILKINEIYTRGDATNPDWVEIYNLGTSEVTLAGWKIFDEGGHTGAKPKKEFPAGATIAAGGFYVITVDDGIASGFGLSSAGETIWLEGPDGMIVDEVAFPALDPNTSYGRLPDGSNNLQILNSPTPGSSNKNNSATVIGNFKINEIYSRGDATNPDWIEIYNAGMETASLDGWKIYDAGGQSGTKPKMEFPSGISLGPGGFYVIVVDDGSAAGFGLSSSGETVWLEAPDGTVKDEVNFPALDVNTSYGRYPDGSNNLQVFLVVTRGLPNDNSTPQPPAKLKINEIYSRGDATNPDWIEIYNAGEGTVSLDGWKIYDNGGQTGTKPKKEFPAGVSLAPGAFYVITVDDGTAAGFGLSSNGEEVWLEKPDGSIADDVVFPALEVNTSYGRLPDGSENLTVLNVVTPGAPNQNNTPPTASLKINEIYSRGIPSDPDWIEIYNPTDQEIELVGWKIYDVGGQSGTKPKKAFPDGAVIPAKGFYVIVTDDGTASAFGLSSNGETVWLENPDGVVVDEVNFPALAENQSYGRKPDGSDNFFIFIEITRGSSNNNAATLPKKKK